MQVTYSKAEQSTRKNRERVVWGLKTPFAAVVRERDLEEMGQ